MKRANFVIVVSVVVALLFASANQITAGPSEYSRPNGILRMKHSPVLGINIPIAVWIDGVQAGAFAKGRDAGWRITVHAGEAGGPQSVWEAVKLLGAERIGHATRALEDPALIDFMLENSIAIEANLTSNVHTSTIPDLASHPLRHMLARGLVASINTDDPGVSAIDLPFEFEVAAPGAGLSREQIRQAQLNALKTAFLSKEEKAAFRKKSS